MAILSTLLLVVPDEDLLIFWPKPCLNRYVSLSRKKKKNHLHSAFRNLSPSLHRSQASCRSPRFLNLAAAIYTSTKTTSMATRGRNYEGVFRHFADLFLMPTGGTILKGNDVRFPSSYSLEVLLPSLNNCRFTRKMFQQEEPPLFSFSSTPSDASIILLLVLEFIPPIHAITASIPSSAIFRMACD